MEGMKLLLTAAALLLAPLPALAGDLTLTVRDGEGQPVADAVVMVYPASGAPPGPIRFPWPYVVSQHDIMFAPMVLVVPVGAAVTFPNNDKVRHHVYSFSAGNKFELKLYGKEDARAVTFRNAGVVALGCNIHDEMSAYIRVVDTPYAIKTGTNGSAVIRAIPGGGATIKIWQPYLRAPKNEMSLTAQIPASGEVRLNQAGEVRASGMKMKP